MENEKIDLARNKLNEIFGIKEEFFPLLCPGCKKIHKYTIKNPEKQKHFNCFNCGQTNDIELYEVDIELYEVKNEHS